MIRYPSMWVAAGLFVVFCFMTQMSAIFLGEVLRALCFALAVSVAASFSKPAWIALKAPWPPDHVGQLAMGIFTLWFSLAVQSFWYVLWRVSGQPLWMINNDLNTFTLYLFCIGAVLHVTAPGAISGVIPARNMVRIGAACGIAALVVAFGMLASDRAIAFVEFLHPLFIED